MSIGYVAGSQAVGRLLRIWLWVATIVQSVIVAISILEAPHVDHIRFLEPLMNWLTLAALTAASFHQVLRAIPANEMPNTTVEPTAARVTPRALLCSGTGRTTLRGRSRSRALGHRERLW